MQIRFGSSFAPSRLFTAACLSAGATLATSGAPPLSAQAVQAVTEARYVASPISQGQAAVLAANRFNAFLVPGGSEGPLAMLAREAGLRGHRVAATQTLEGATLAEQWRRGASEPDQPLRRALQVGGVDVLMLTLGGSEPDEGLERFADLMVETNMAGRILVQDPWAAGAQGATDPARVVALRERLLSIDTRARHEMAFYVPAADAVERLRWEVAAGTVPGVGRQTDLFTSGSGRPSGAVANLVTYLWFTVLYRQPAEGLTALVDPADPTSMERERVLQRIAWEAAVAEPASGLMLDDLWIGRTQGLHVHPQPLSESEPGHAGHDGHQ